MFVLLGVAQTQRPQFLREQPAEFKLARRTRVSGRRLVGLGVNADVTAETVEERVHDNSFKRRFSDKTSPGYILHTTAGEHGKHHGRDGSYDGRTSSIPS